MAKKYNYAVLKQEEKMEKEFCLDYISRLKSILEKTDWGNVCQFGDLLNKAWRDKKNVFLCGNGGSAGNSMHLANDFIYGVAKSRGVGIRAIALPSNTSVITCLANDESYDAIYEKQLEVQADEGDILIVLSGSGNSPNVVNALKKARELKMESVAILGFSGGVCKELADVAIHFPCNDMQISEDLQLIVGHMLMQWLSQSPAV